MSTQTQIAKYKEVWRNTDGQFAAAPKPVVVEKPKPEPKQDAVDIVPAALLLGGSVVVMAVVFWQITATLATLALAGYALRWHLSKEKLVINNWGG